MLLFLACIRSRKNKNRPSIRAAVRGDSLSELCVPRIERFCRPRHRGVSWPGCRIRCHHRTTPDAGPSFSSRIDRCQRYSGTVIAQISRGCTTLVCGVEKWWWACRVTTLGGQPPATGATRGRSMSPKSPVAYTVSKTVDQGTRYFNQVDHLTQWTLSTDQPHHFVERDM